MERSDPEATIREKYERLKAVLNERTRRVWAATEAQVLGHGGQSLVARATGISLSAIQVGKRELVHGLTRADERTEASRVRRAGGGRRRLTEKEPKLRQALEALVEPMTRGDPCSSLRWTCKSTRHLAQALGACGYQISHDKVAELLAEMGYSLQANRKTEEGTTHPDRNAQFEYIAAQVAAFQHRGAPVVSVDTKKKEWGGNYKNGGREWQRHKQPARVQVHDFPDPALGKAIPYGVYDPTTNTGWVRVGTDHDTAEFAVATLQRWWDNMGQERYPQATELLITAAAGGSNSSRSRLWKLALQRWATVIGVKLTVCHLPPGTSKWNKIEHRMCSYITCNWRSRPLVSHEAVVQLISHTTTTKGLRIKAGLDRASYPTGKKISAAELKRLNLSRHAFHGDWNYTISPQTELLTM
jgi:hypothetical protein